MYESPLFLAAHEEESGGRSVPTTPLQVAAPGKPQTPPGFLLFIQRLSVCLLVGMSEGCSHLFGAES